MTFDIEWVPWEYESPGGQSTYYRATNRPAAVVLHRMQGHYSTARAWALSGHYGASWHYSIDDPGDIMQHLAHNDGGFHAGIPATAPNPTWPLWRGHGQNINHYTIGIEMAGFAGEPHSPEQLAALKYLCKTLSREIGIPYDREHFPAHAEIDVVNRVNDFNTPAIREEVYAYLFEEAEDMADPRVDALIAALGGQAAIDKWNANGNSLLAGYAAEQAKLGALIQTVEAHTKAPHAGGLAPGTEFTAKVKVT